MIYPWVKIRVAKALGSTPRPQETVMYIRPSDKEGEGVIQKGSIGGGALEYRAIEIALEMFEESLFGISSQKMQREFPLGPTLQQCCGGYVALEFSFVESLENNYDGAPSIESAKNPPILIFGAGHVGQALYTALLPLPYDVYLFDQRPLANAESYKVDDIDSLLLKYPQAIIYIMTHSHQLDLDILVQILNIGTFEHLGLIGSKSKKARFNKQLSLNGVDENAIGRVHCPIGIKGITGKEPVIIAASVCAEILQITEVLNIKNNNI